MGNEEKLEIFTGEKEPFAVTDLKSAEWCMKKIADRTAQKAELQKFVADKKGELDAYLAAETRSLDTDIEFFSEKLLPWTQEQIANGKKQSVNLPSGTAGIRKQPPEFVRDEAVLLKYAEQNAANCVKHSVDWAELKKTFQIDGEKAVTADGEIIPGIKVVAKEPKFYVKVVAK